MKKILLGTTALVAASMIAGQSQAADPVKLGLGGFMVQTFGFMENDNAYETASQSEFQSTDQKQTSEIHFKGSTKLDNGIGVAVQLEMNSDGNSNFGMDEVYMTLTSDSMGMLRLGQVGGAAVLQRHIAPTGGVIAVNGGEVQPWAFVQTPGNVAVGQNGADRSFELSDNADNKVIYQSPTFMGFSAAASYTPDDNATSFAVQPRNTAGGWEVSLAYNETLSGVAVGADVSRTVYAGAGDSNNTYSSWGGGLNLGYAGFTFGGSYEALDERVSTDTNWSAATDNTGHFWDIGVTYETGPYKIGVTYASAEAEGSLLDGDTDTADQLVFGATYTLGPGVMLTGDLMVIDWEDENPNAAANNNDGWALNAGLVVAF